MKILRGRSIGKRQADAHHNEPSHIETAFLCGNAVDEAFEDALIAWQTRYVEGTVVFKAEDPGRIASQRRKRNRCRAKSR
ncbi:MAG: hypothetical protein ACODTL_08455 [Brucella sp.]